MSWQYLDSLSSNIGVGTLEAHTLRGLCPHCGMGTHFSLSTMLDDSIVENIKPERVFAGYHCDLCRQPIAVCWAIGEAVSGRPSLLNPVMVERTRPVFDFTHVPDGVKREIEEGLDCLSVEAHNGFAAMCRRAVQAICTDLGAEASTKVKSQLLEAFKLGEIAEETQTVAMAIMLAGHDGSHPHLPGIDEPRARVLFELLRDLTYQLYTRPGRVKESMALRAAAIEREKQ